MKTSRRMKASANRPQIAKTHKPNGSKQTQGGPPGPDLILAVEDYFRRYAVLGSGLPLVLALWNIATYMYDVFDAFPYLAITSPTKRCGKSRLGELIGMVCSKPLETVGISPAALFRTIEQKSPTLIIDEAESLSIKSESSEALREVLNAGYRKGKKVWRCASKTHKIEQFNIYCAKVLILIGKLQDTLSDRCISVPMKRKSGEQIDRFRFAHVEKQTAPLRTEIEQWSSAHASQVEQWYADNGLLFIQDRDEELWLPLFAVCQVAAPERLDELEAIAIGLASAKEDDPNNYGIEILADIRRVFVSGGAKNTSSEELLKALNAMSESPWQHFKYTNGQPLDARWLAKLLKPFGIHSKTIRMANGTPKGFYRADFEDAWKRYLPSATAATQPKNQSVSGDSASATATPCGGAQTDHNSNESSDVAAVAADTGIISPPVGTDGSPRTYGNFKNEFPADFDERWGLRN